MHIISKPCREPSNLSSENFSPITALTPSISDLSKRFDPETSETRGAFAGGYPRASLVLDASTPWKLKQVL